MSRLLSSLYLMYRCERLHMCVCLCVIRLVYKQLYRYIFRYLCVYKYMHSYIYIDMQIHKFIHMQLIISMYICVHIYIYIDVCVLCVYNVQYIIHTLSTDSRSAETVSEIYLNLPSSTHNKIVIPQISVFLFFLRCSSTLY